MENLFQIKTPFSPAGDQPDAIIQLAKNAQAGLYQQVLLGVTGSGKTYTMAHVIQSLQRPTIIFAPNKTLAAQLYSEMRSFFPHNAVEYFVSYYDYYQPEAYVPTSDTYIAKDASVNAHIEQMRLSATKALLERRDTIIVASVSAIYGLGDPKSYMQMLLHVSKGEQIDESSILRRLTDLQYNRNNILQRGTYRVQGDIIDIFPADSETEAVRISIFDDEVESIHIFDPLTNQILKSLPRVTIYPKTHYATPKDILNKAIQSIERELQQQLSKLTSENKLLEAQRLEQRTQFDLEMLKELGYCNGVENYSRYLSSRKEGEPPPCLFDYLPPDGLLVIDESHVTIPQLHGMYKGDHSRKKTLVEYGFRLPSALDNRPLKFEEFMQIAPQMIFVSATPGNYELESSSAVIEQVVRPTGLIDPIVEVRPIINQVDDLYHEIIKCKQKNERILVTTLTKKMAEDLTEYLTEQNIAVRYLHSDIDAVERVEIIRDLRLGKFDVLVGINLLREGLDIPEVSLVAILDADKEGFLRSERSLIQTIGRAARNINGKALLYADNITQSMQKAIEETQRRREKQQLFNEQNHITPRSIQKQIVDILEIESDYIEDAEYQIADNKASYHIASVEHIDKTLKELEKEMYLCAEKLEFEKAAQLRDKIQELRKQRLSL